MSANKDTTSKVKQVVEESLEELYEDAPCGYVYTLPDGAFAKVNRTFLAWTGYQQAELLGRRFQDLLTVPGKMFYETHYAPLLRMQGFVHEIAFDLVCRDSRPLPVLISTVEKRDDSGTPLLNRTTIFNATDRRKYEQELRHARDKAEQALQAKARFLAMISHEIRNPITSIIVASRLLERTDLDPQQQKYVRTLSAVSQNLLALVNDLLDYHKLESDMVTLEESRFNIREFIRDVLDRMAARAEEKKLVVQAEIDERIPICLIYDQIKLGQILTNLLGNAIKFTERGSVTLRLQVTELLPKAVAIDFSVQDTGIGIAPDRLEYIFEEFTQVSSDITAKYGGTGLGLAISQKLLRLYGSEIRVTSEPYRGSTFSFNLRLKTE